MSGPHASGRYITSILFTLAFATLVGVAVFAFIAWGYFNG